MEQYLEAKRCLNATNATVEQLETEREEKERRILALEGVITSLENGCLAQGFNAQDFL